LLFKLSLLLLLFALSLLLGIVCGYLFQRHALFVRFTFCLVEALHVTREAGITSHARHHRFHAVEVIHAVPLTTMEMEMVVEELLRMRDHSSRKGGGGLDHVNQEERSY
jgi:hypothetical protein